MTTTALRQAKNY